MFDFEVIQIIDDNNPYPTLLGIDSDIDMNGVIDMKKRTISFERKLLQFSVLLDPTEGAFCIELVRDYDKNVDELDQIY